MWEIKGFENVLFTLADSNPYIFPENQKDLLEGLFGVDNVFPPTPGIVYQKKIILKLKRDKANHEIMFEKPNGYILLLDTLNVPIDTKKISDFLSLP